MTPHINLKALITKISRWADTAESARRNAVDNLANADTAESGWRHVKGIAHSEAQATAFTRFINAAERAIDHGLEGETAAVGLFSLLTKMALKGPDDSWSGRDNDLARVYADGFREAVQMIYDELRY